MKATPRRPILTLSLCAGLTWMLDAVSVQAGEEPPSNSFSSIKELGRTLGRINVRLMHRTDGGFHVALKAATTRGPTTDASLDVMGYRLWDTHGFKRTVKQPGSPSARLLRTFMPDGTDLEFSSTRRSVTFHISYPEGVAAPRVGKQQIRDASLTFARGRDGTVQPTMARARIGRRTVVHRFPGPGMAARCNVRGAAKHRPTPALGQSPRTTAKGSP